MFAWPHLTVRRLARWLPLALLLAAAPLPARAQKGKDKDDEDLWAVRCITLYGPERFAVLKKYEEALKKVSGLKKDRVQVVHAEDSSALFYGRYQRTYIAAENREKFDPDPAADINLIRQLSVAAPDGRNVWPFALATLEPLPGGDPGNPEWELSRARGAWSLHVAVFYNTKEMKQRKKAAVEYCKLLRQQGEEAYYHHGPVNSSVCIGAFPEGALRNVQVEDPYTGVMNVKTRIVDERLLKLKEKYPVSLENGHKINQIQRSADGKIEQRVPLESFVVAIPKPGAPLGGG